jgi:hypothetical protein
VAFVPRYSTIDRHSRYAVPIPVNGPHHDARTTTSGHDDGDDEDDERQPTPAVAVCVPPALNDRPRHWWLALVVGIGGWHWWLALAEWPGSAVAATGRLVVPCTILILLSFPAKAAAAEFGHLHGVVCSVD